MQLSRRWYITNLGAPGAHAHHLQNRTACKIQNGRWGAPKISLNTFFDQSAPSMRKVDGGKKRIEKKEKEKSGVFSGHYVIASSLPPKRLRPNDDRWNAARSCQFLVPPPLLEGEG